MDLSKAFTLSIIGFLSKILESTPLMCLLLNWLKIIFQVEMYVKFQGTDLDCKPLLTGVQQGSVLGHYSLY